MQAIILAAGMGKRLGELTKNNTKCMVQVNGVTLIERLLRQLDRVAETRGLSRIVIVVGYVGKKPQEYIATLGSRCPWSLTARQRAHHRHLFAACTAFHPLPTNCHA